MNKRNVQRSIDWNKGNAKIKLTIKEHRKKENIMST